MYTVNTKIEDKRITIVLEGSIDSSNAEEVKSLIANAFGNNTFEQLVFEVENLKYISSAGLRVILFFRKKVPECTMLNASAEVYDILEMTGFTEMMTVKKAYRKVSVDGCEVIGEGANGIFYRLNDDTGIKVYKHPDCLEDIERELKLARFAQVAFIPTALSYDVVIVGDKYGSVFELLNAKSFLQVIQAEPERIDECIDRSVEIMKTMHSAQAKVDYLPNMKVKFRRYLESVKKYLSADDVEKLEKLYATIPEDTTYLHGDYHFKNIMLQGEDALLIDMDTLCYGNPIFELAGVFNAYMGYGELDPKGTEDFLGISFQTASYICNSIFEKYIGTKDSSKLDEAKLKAHVISYIRILEHYVRHGKDLGERKQEFVDFYTKRLVESIRNANDLII